MPMRYIKIDYNGYIYPIRMNGPIVTPLLMDEKVAMDTVISGYRCTEVDVKAKKEIKLTIDNFYKDDRFGIKSAKIPNTPKIDVEYAEVKTVKLSNDSSTEPAKAEIEKSLNEENKEKVITTDIDTNNSEENKTYNFNKNKDKKNKNK